MDFWLPTPDWSGDRWSGSNGYGKTILVWGMSIASVIVGSPFFGGGSW